MRDSGRLVTNGFSKFLITNQRNVRDVNPLRPLSNTEYNKAVGVEKGRRGKGTGLVVNDEMTLRPSLHLPTFFVQMGPFRLVFSFTSEVKDKGSPYKFVR